MNTLTEHAPAMLAAVLIAFTYYVVRTRTRAAHEAVMAHSKEARELLLRQAKAVARFLDSPDAPETLKALLRAYDDAMTDQTGVARLAAWAESAADAPGAETDAYAADLAALRMHHPDLAEDFTTAIFSGAMAASLSRPQTAVNFEHMFARLLTTPRRDVAMAVAATRQLFPA